MAIAWSEIVAKPEYKSLSDADKQAARDEYFDYVVMPQLKPHDVEDAYLEFTNYDRSLAPPAPVPTTRTWGEAATDVGASFGAGANALLETGGKVAGLTGLSPMDNWATEQGKSGREYFEAKKSGSLKADEAARRAAIDQSEGQWNKAGTAIWETIKNPALLSSFMAEQAPMFLPIAAVGRGAQAASLASGAAGKVAGAANKLSSGIESGGLIARTTQKGLSGLNTAELAAGAIGTTAAIGAGAVLQGGDVGGDAYAELLKLPQNFWEQNPDYQQLRQKLGDQKAKEAISLDLAQRAGTEGAVASVLTNLLPFARTFERAASKAPTNLTGNFVARGIKGGMGEAAQEASEEGLGRVSVNRAVQDIDQTRELSQGVGEAAGLGAIGGGVMGAGAGMLTKAPPPTTIEESPLTPAAPGGLIINPPPDITVAPLTKANPSDILAQDTVDGAIETFTQSLHEGDLSSIIQESALTPAAPSGLIIQPPADVTVAPLTNEIAEAEAKHEQFKTEAAQNPTALSLALEKAALETLTKLKAEQSTVQPPVVTAISAGEQAAPPIGGNNVSTNNLPVGDRTVPTESTASSSDNQRGGNAAAIPLPDGGGSVPGVPNIAGTPLASDGQNQSVTNDGDAALERRTASQRRAANIATMSAEDLRKNVIEQDRRIRTDNLTGIRNRVAYDEVIADHAANNEQPPLHMFMDINNQKQINEKFGYQGGDAAIKALAQAAQQVNSESFRLGGDEFIGLVKSQEEADTNAAKIKEIMDNAVLEYTAPDGQIYIQKGIGFTYGTGHDIKSADESGKKAKAASIAKGLSFTREQADAMAQDVTAGRQAENKTAEIAPAVNQVSQTNAQRLKVLDDGRHAAIGFTREQLIKAGADERGIDAKGQYAFPAKTNKIQLERALGISNLPEGAILAEGDKPYLNQKIAITARKNKGLDKTHITLKLEDGGYALVPKVIAPEIQVAQTAAKKTLATPPSKLQASTDERLADPARRADLEKMQSEFGWAQRGGSIFRNPSGDVVGGTLWEAIDERQLWQGRPDQSISPSDAKNIVKDALNGKPLKASGHRFIQYLLDVSVAREQEIAALESDVASAEAGLTDEEYAALDERMISAVKEVGQEEVDKLTNRNPDIAEMEGVRAWYNNLMFLYQNAIDVSAAKKEQGNEQIQETVTGVTEGSGQGSGNETGTRASQETLSLTSPTEKGLRRQEARAADTSVEDRAAADRASAVPLTLATQSAEKTTGATQQGSMFTPDGRTTVAAESKPESKQEKQVKPAPTNTIDVHSGIIQVSELKKYDADSGSILHVKIKTESGEVKSVPALQAMTNFNKSIDAMEKLKACLNAR